MKLALKLGVALAAPAVALGAYMLVPSNIDPANKFSWGENIGWMNWYDAGGSSQGVVVGPNFLSGKVWSENTGWMDTGSGAGPYANTTGLDFGVNVLGNGDLDGYGWGENGGWINFGWAASTANPDRARFDTGAGRFRGWAWGENVGWINLDDATHHVGTASVPPPTPLANPIGTCSISNAVCSTLLNNCPIGQTCNPWGQNRFISFSIPASGAGMQTAIRVRLASLHHPGAPIPLNTPNFGTFEGQYRYVNAVPGALSRCCNPSSSPLQCNTSVSCITNADCIGLGVNSVCKHSLCPDSASLASFVHCARLACAPEYRDWATELGGDVVYSYGDSVAPSSTYAVASLADSCAGIEATCPAASAEVSIDTPRWGNVDNSGAGVTVPNAIDISRVVDRVKDVPGAFAEPICMLQAQTPNPLSQAASALDIARSVDSVKGFAYPFGINACP